MPSPTSALTTLRPDLAGSFMEFELAMDRQGFIASRVLPIIEVAKQTGPFGKIPIEQLLQESDTARAPGSGYARGNFTFGTDTFTTLEHGREEAVDDRESKMYALYFDAEMISAQRAMDVVLRNAERRVADAVFNPTTWTSNKTTITNEWDDFVNAEPEKDVLAAKTAVWDASGMWPNALIINRRVFNNLLQVQAIIERIKFAGITDPRAGAITEAALAQVFDIDQLIVAGAAKNTAIEGQSVSINPVWSDEYAMVAKIARTNDIREPCIGRTMHWAEDGSSTGGTVETYRDETKRADIVRVRQDLDEKILYVEAGHLLENVTT